MVNILDFISEKNRKDLSEHLHWCRGENKIDIENAAQQINCSVTQLDNWESGKEKITTEALVALLTLYNEKISIYFGDYNDVF